MRMMLLAGGLVLVAGPGRTNLAAVKLEVVGRPLAQVAEQIGKAGGPKVRVDPEIRDWKATVVYTGDPAGLLQLLSQNFGLTISYKEKTGTYQLLLSETQRRHLREWQQAQEEKRKARAELARRGIREKLAELLPKIDALKDDPRATIFRDLEPGARPLLQLVGSLRPKALEAIAEPKARELIVDGRTMAFVRTPSVSIPFNSLTEEQQNLFKSYILQRIGLANERQEPSEGWQDLLQRLDGSTLEFLNLEGVTLSVSPRLPGVNNQGAIEIVHSTVPGLFPLGLKTLEEMKTTQKAQAAEPTYPEDERKADVVLEDADYGQAVVALAEAAHVNLVADSFTLWRRLTISPKNAPLRETLNRFSGAFRVRHRWQNGALLLRSWDWEERLESEPPAAVLDRVVAVYSTRMALPVAERAFVVSHLTDRQIGCLACWHTRLLSLQAECQEMLPKRALYQFCAALSADQLKQLENRQLRVSALSRPQQAALLGLGGTEALNVPNARLFLEEQPGPALRCRLQVLNEKGYFVAALE